MLVSKAPGLDSISSRVLKMVTSAISSSLTSLFNFSLLKGLVTSEGKFARVTPVPKKEAAQSMLNNFIMCQCSLWWLRPLRG